MKLFDFIVICALSTNIGICTGGLFGITERLNDFKTQWTIEDSLKQNDDPTLSDAVTMYIIIQFYLDYGTEDHAIISVDTAETYNHYFISNVYYHIDFDNNLYETKYISYIEAEKIFSKEVVKQYELPIYVLHH